MNSSTVLVSWYGKNVNCKNMNSSTVLVSWYEYEKKKMVPWYLGTIGTRIRVTMHGLMKA